MWGFQILNDGVETLGMGDFTIRKIFEATVPGIRGSGAGHINAPYSISVPGYSADQCFVVMTPKVYAQGGQSGNSAYVDLKTPTYVDLGGESIGIIRYINYSLYQNDRWSTFHTYLSSECTVEVFRVYGG